MFCPKCRTEYRDGFTVCADCRIELVDAILPEPEAEWLDLVEISVIENPAKMAFISSILEEQGITYFFKSGAFMNASMAVDPAILLVRSDQGDAARRILDEVTQSLEEERVSEGNAVSLQQGDGHDDAGASDLQLDDEEFEDETGIYAEQWQYYSELKGWAVIVIAAGFPFVVVVLFIANLLFKDIRILPFWGLIASAFISATIQRKYYNWPCPRCGSAFHRRDHIRNLWSSECLHCGLPKWECHDIGNRKDMLTDELACLNCGHLIGEDESNCPNCGWNWDSNTSLENITN